MLRTCGFDQNEKRRCCSAERWNLIGMDQRDILLREWNLVIVEKGFWEWNCLVIFFCFLRNFLLSCFLFTTIQNTHVSRVRTSALAHVCQVIKCNFCFFWFGWTIQWIPTQCYFWFRVRLVHEREVWDFNGGEVKRAERFNWIFNIVFSREETMDFNEQKCLIYILCHRII